MALPVGFGGGGIGMSADTLRSKAKLVETFMRLIDVPVDLATEQKINALIATF